jgi:threonine synthase
VTDLSSDNPFIRYRQRLDSYAAALASGRSDADFVALVRRIDEAIAEVAGHGFLITPTRASPELAEALSIEASIHVKDDTGNVGGSHKARHLFGVMLHLAVAGNREGELAIASCGNAAVAAATLARAVDRPLRVFIPTWADPLVVGILQSLDATIEVCERRSGEVGDPTHLRFSESLDAGLIPFSVQATSTPTTLDGGRTLGWELADQLADSEGRIRLFVQVGGGALASSAWMGLREGTSNEALLHAVQTEACAPLARAWRLVTEDLAASLGAELPDDPSRTAGELRGHEGSARRMMADDPGRYMWPWEPIGESSATGVLDDVTYDWPTVVGPMVESGGWPIVVNEGQVSEANRLGRETTGIDVDATGTAGLAGLLDPVTRSTIENDDRVVVLFTGLRRTINP